MFKSILAGSFLFLIGSANIMAADSLYLHIDLLDRETSKDSNSRRYIVEVKTKEVRYEYSYRGFPDNVDESKARTLSDDELSEIIGYIKATNIDDPTTEITAHDANGPSRSVALSLFLQLGGQTTESEISGNYKIFRADGAIEGELIKNTKYVDDVRSLILMLRKIE